MKIEVRLFASLGKYLPDNKIGDPCFMGIEPEETVGHILTRLKVPTDLPKVIIINGRRGSAENILYFRWSGAISFRFHAGSGRGYFAHGGQSGHIKKRDHLLGKKRKRTDWPGLCHNVPVHGQKTLEV